MPTQRQYKLPLGDSPSEFEDIVADVVRKLWSDPDACRYGSSGQRQHGADIVGSVRLFGTVLGVGICQARSSTKLNWLEAEASLAEIDEHFKDAVLVLFATGSRRSTHDHDRARQLTEERAHAGLCEVRVIAWEDIEDVLLADDVLLRSHYPDYVKVVETPVVKTRGVSGRAAALLAVGGILFGGLFAANSIAGAADEDDDDYE